MQMLVAHNRYQLKTTVAKKRGSGFEKTNASICTPTNISRWADITNDDIVQDYVEDWDEEVVLLATSRMSIDCPSLIPNALIFEEDDGEAGI